MIHVIVPVYATALPYTCNTHCSNRMMGHQNNSITYKLAIIDHTFVVRSGKDLRKLNLICRHNKIYSKKKSNQILINTT